MIRVKKYMLPAVVILLLLTGIFLFPVIMMKLFRQETGEWKALEALLQKQETVIDGVREGTAAYTLLSREGRSDYGDIFAVFEQDGTGEWNRVYENDFADLKPWKLELADIDGDGTKEILTAVRKTTHFDPDEKNRMFIFNYENNILVKKWTGSQIAGIWKDFIAGDLLPISGDELIFIEQTEDGLEKISIYYWFDFGFLLLAESDGYKDIRNLTLQGENSIQITYDDGRTAALTVQHGKVVRVAPKQ
jgi:hypothetical protein